MRRKSKIVSFEDAQRASAALPASRRLRRNDALSDKENLSLIFKIEFNDNDSFDSGSSSGNFARENARESEASIYTDVADDKARKKRNKAKAKAERKYLKTYGDANGSISGGASGNGPRAALYKTDMGSSQKRANRMQRSGSSGGLGGFSLGAFSLPQISLTSFSRKITSIAAVFVCAALLFGALYTPAQQCYQQIRERDRLAAEYDALAQRNDALSKSVEILQTEDGLEARAHSDFGMVKEGEKSASVTGIDVVDSTDFQANIPPGSVPAPKTWYSDFLDMFFMYGN